MFGLPVPHRRSGDRVSGKLVGEVIDAHGVLRARGVTERGFMALIAIAEKAHTDSRQASVRWDHLCAGLFGASKRTAERAVRELKSAGALAVVRPGFNNNHGVSRAPLYEIARLADTDATMSVSPPTDTDIAVSDIGGTDTDKSETDTDKPGRRYRHPGVVLDGSFDGSTDGTTNYISRADKGHRLPAGWEPPTAVMNELRERWPHIDLAEALEEFRDYWCAEAGARARKADWSLTFRNRVRQLAKQRQEKGERRNGSGGNANGGGSHAQKIAGWDDAAATAFNELTNPRNGKEIA